MKAHAIILAAGQGTRMKSALPKVLHPIGGRPMLVRVIETAVAAGIADTSLVLGHGAETVQAKLTECLESLPPIAIQSEQLGTGHAVLQALPDIDSETLVVVLYGDVPLVTTETLRRLIVAAGDGLGLVTVRLNQPFGYGRIIRDADGGVLRIVEEKDASTSERAIREVNTGLLAAPAGSLRRWLTQVRNKNAKGEYYLTDVVRLAVAEGVPVSSVEALDPQEVEGVNDPLQLGTAERTWQRREAERMMREGLYINDAGRFDVRGTLKFGRDVHVDVGVIFEGNVELGNGVYIGPYTLVKNAKIGAGTRVEANCVLDDCTVGEDAKIGPFARLRPGAALAREVHIGNFVEIKKSTLGEGTKANHLAYIGDATVGRGVNIGAGVITCNYDGVNKHQTIIGDDAFIGTDSQLVAPVTIGDRAYIAAGSTIAKPAPADALTICRHREQQTFKNWRRPVKKNS